MGLTNIKKSTNNSALNGPEITTHYKAQNNLSYANVALGTATIITNTFNLLLSKKIGNANNAINIYSYPDNKSVAVGVYFAARL